MAGSQLRLAATFALLATACGSGDGPTATGAPPTAGSPSPRESAQLEVIATDFAFDVATPVRAGSYDVTLVNLGDKIHHAQLYRLQDGATFDEFEEVLLSHPERDFFGLPEEALSLLEGPATGVLATIPAGQTGTGRLELQPGSYALVCVLIEIDVGSGGEAGRTAHYALGMMSELQVE